MKEPKDYIENVAYFSPVLEGEYRQWNGYHFFSTFKALSRLELSRSEDYLAVL